MSTRLPGETELENRPSIEAKALRINLNKYIYGTFAEIGGWTRSSQGIFLELAVHLVL